MRSCDDCESLNYLICCRKASVECLTFECLGERMKVFMLSLVGALVLVACGKKKDDTPAATDCYVSNVKPIVDAKCAACHTASHQTSKFYESKTAFLASTAKSRVAAGTMPPTGSTALTAAERTTFADCN